ncbi:MAG: 4Fe-4S binding protein [Thermodesulfobacteriota bacterium]|nr:4Fe-4S binding protein [Thermodesulfobacteriota bacterium]
MPSEVYKALREQLDQYSCGFPTTESGVEFKILERLFTEEEARLYLNLSMKLETPEAVAKRLNRDPEEIAAILHGMGKKGTLFTLRVDDTYKFAVLPFVLGIYEFQLEAMDREMSALCEQYFEEAFLDYSAQVDPLMRTIPVNRSIEVPHQIATYEDSREIVKKQKLIALAKCICRVQQGLLEKSCDKPLEVCLMFGAWGQHFIDEGMARKITVDEALKVLDLSEEAGLVTQPASSQNPGGMCNCCGECCAILRGLNKLPRPAEVVLSNYFAVVDPDLCTSCETCIDRCQMEAIVMSDADIAEINLDRCIGCGLCVTTCPTEALRLQIKPEDQRREPPETQGEAMAMMAEKRGKSMVPLAFQRASS